MNKYTSILVFLFCLALSYPCDAQSGSRKKAAQDTYDFVPGENVVFYDDFSGHKEGTYPERWEILNDHIGPTTDEWEVVKASVTKLDNAWCLYFKKGNHPFGMPHWDTTNYTALYKDNYWSIEFDFRFFIIKNNSENDISIFIRDDSTSYEYIDFDRSWATKDSQSYCMWAYCNKGNVSKTSEGCYPVRYDTTIWHHFAVAITSHGTFGYIDRCKLSTLPALGLYLPNLTIFGRAPVAIKNFRLARTDSAHRKLPEASVPMAALLTENKFVTHAITFDKNKAMIKPESMAFINQLAAFLKANAAIRLYIDGHTDSDGTVDANLKLSQNRAEAIKKKLTSMGIAPDRLQTRGFGATQPVENNATPEGMAQNRRVEFVKQ